MALSIGIRSRSILNGTQIGLEMGDSSVVRHPHIKARSNWERTSFRPRSIPGCCAKGLLHR